MALYQSEITRFLKDLKESRPQIEQQQRIGRAIYWDKPQNLETLERYRESRVPQQPYVYQIKG